MHTSGGTIPVALNLQSLTLNRSLVRCIVPNFFGMAKAWVCICFALVSTTALSMASLRISELVIESNSKSSIPPITVPKTRASMLHTSERISGYSLRSADVRSYVQVLDLDSISTAFNTPDSTLYVNEGKMLAGAVSFSTVI